MNFERESLSKQAIRKGLEIYFKWTIIVCFSQLLNAQILAKFTRTSNELSRKNKKCQIKWPIKFLANHFGLKNSRLTLKKECKVLVLTSSPENNGGKKYLNWLQTNLQKTATNVLKRFALK